jgi:hypothetical protein
MNLRISGLLAIATFALTGILGGAQVQAQFTQQGPKLVGTGAVGLASQGHAVSLSAAGNTAIVGGPEDDNGDGAAWVYTRSGGVWSQQAKLVGTGAIGLPEQGLSVSLSGDGNTAIVGGPGDYGAAWVYTRSGGVWGQQAQLVGTGAIGVPRQGWSVSLSADGNIAIVGGPSDNNSAGAVWAYMRSDGLWSQQGPKLVGSAAVGPYVAKGASVSLSGDGNTAIVGGRNDNMLVGAAWVFTQSGGIWSQQGPKLVGIGAVGGAQQGWSVSLSGDGNTAIVGGLSDDSDAGAAWVFAQPVFAGTPGKANCHGKSVSALAQQYGGLNNAAADLGYSSVSGLQDAILEFCEG